MPRTPGQHAQFIDRKFKRPLPEPTIDVPDHVLESELIALGMPRDQMFTRYRQTMPGQYRYLRTLALKMYMDIIYARRGDPEAKERIDYCREVWQEMARRRLIQDGERYA